MPKERLGEHRRDIMDGTRDKAVPLHFYNTRSTEDALVFVPFKRSWSSNRMVLRHFETKAINNFNLLEAGSNRILS